MYLCGGVCVVALILIGAPVWAYLALTLIMMMAIILDIYAYIYVRRTAIRTSGQKCARCDRAVELGDLPPGGINEWLGKWVDAGWIHGTELLLECVSCHQVYCGECAPSFSSHYLVTDVTGRPLFPQMQCGCGSSKFRKVAGRQKGTGSENIA